MKLAMTIEPSSQLSDIRALLDSYAVEVKKNNQTYLRAPIFMVDMPGPLESQPRGTDLFPAIDKTITLRLCRFEPAPEDRQHQRPYTRWPFFVEHPLTILFTLEAQFWQFYFSPGRQYEEREIGK